MSTFDSLTLAFEDWFATALCDLPDNLRQRVKKEFPPVPWDDLAADQRRSGALQMDYQHDPATEEERKYWWDFFQRIDNLKEQLAQWEVVATPTAGELALRETRLIELQQELARMDTQKRQARGDYYPTLSTRDCERQTSPGLPIQYVAYPKAMNQLAKRLGATPEELAAWVWIGPKDGGIAAYMNANELAPPPRFFYATGGDSKDYIAPLMACWFHADDIAQFEPADRYIVGAALIERWSALLGLHAVAFIQAKIVESRLLDIHPIYLGTRGAFSEDSDLPPLESGLFPLSQVEQIEAEDFAKAVNFDSVNKPELGSAEWRSQNAQTAANALHDKPGGSRDKQNQIRTIWASGKYSSRNICAEQEFAGLNMSYDAARKALNNTPEPSRC